MDKRISILLIILGFLCFSFLVYHFEYKGNKITEVMDIKNNDITRIVITNGRDLSKYVTFEDTKKLNEFMKLLRAN